MNTFAFSGLLIGISSLSLGIFVYLKNRQNRTNQIFTLFAITVAIWGFGGCKVGLTQDQSAALFWWKVTYIGIIFIPILLYHFVYAFLKLKKRKLLYLIYSYGLFYLILEWTPWADLYFGLSNMEFVFSSFYWVYPPTPLFLFFVFSWYAIVTYSLYELHRAFKKSFGLKRAQIKYFFLAMAIGFAGGGTCYFPCFGIKLYPFLNLTVPLYPAIMTYAIVAHRLMDINVVITRSLAYGTITAVIAGAYVGLMMGMDRIFADVAGYSPALAHSLLFVVVLFALIYVLPQMKIRALEITRRALFRGKYDYQQELSEATRAIPTMLDIKQLGKYVLTKIRDTMMVDKLALLVYDEAEHTFPILTFLGLDKDTVSKIKVRENSALPGLLRSSNSPIIKEELKNSGAVPEGATELAIEQLDSLDAELCIPLMIRDDLTGIVTLSNKKTGEMYTDEDLSLFATLANQVALTIEYIKAVDKITSEKRYVGLGKAAMRMAHDIKNPLVPLKTFLQILPDKYPKEFKEMSKIDQEFTGRFYESALEGVDRINLLIERALHFARHPEPVFSQVQINAILDEVLTQEEIGLRQRNVQLQKEYDTEDNNIKADGEQLIELFSNLIANSIEAMETTPTKKLMVKTRALGDRVAVEIIDTGCGIPRDKIDTIFDPFITYKHKGSGLGLAIAKKVVDDHKGSIEVNSEPGKGTIFKVILPKK